MTHVVSDYRDRPEADAAARRLADAGIPAEHVHVQHRARTPVNETSVQVDELAAGGIFHDIGKLLDGLLGQRRPPEEAATYEDAVRMEAEVAVIVDADSVDEVERAEAILREAGARHVVRH